jgi:hypothetical protein
MTCSLYKGTKYLLLFLFFLFFILPLFFKTGLSNIPDYLAASGSGGSSNLPGPNDFKLYFNHILTSNAYDTDKLANFMLEGFRTEV